MDLKSNTLDNFLADNQLGIELKTENKILYHYTGAEAAAAIIKDGMLCSNSQIMKDEHGFAVGHKILETHPCRICYGLSWEELCSQEDKSVRSWIFSLCRRQNDIMMIQKYACGKAGGPAQLQFCFNHLYKGVREEMEKDLTTWKLTQGKNRCYHFLLPCLYYPSQNSIIQKVEEFLFGDYLSLLIEQQSDLCSSDFAFACKNIFLAMVKEDKYREEHEYRLVKITFDGSNEKRQPFGITYKPKRVPLPFVFPIFENKECPK